MRFNIFRLFGMYLLYYTENWGHYQILNKFYKHLGVILEAITGCIKGLIFKELEK